MLAGAGLQRPDQGLGDGDQVAGAEPELVAHRRIKACVEVAGDANDLGVIAPVAHSLRMQPDALLQIQHRPFVGGAQLFALQETLVKHRRGERRHGVEYGLHDRGEGRLNAPVFDGRGQDQRLEQFSVELLDVLAHLAKTVRTDRDLKTIGCEGSHDPFGAMLPEDRLQGFGIRLEGGDVRLGRVQDGRLEGRMILRGNAERPDLEPGLAARATGRGFWPPAFGSFAHTRLPAMWLRPLHRSKRRTATNSSIRPRCPAFWRGANRRPAERHAGTFLPLSLVLVLGAGAS
ncbi:hypothetical protein D3C87_1177480 [compost metagenome]